MYLCLLSANKLKKDKVKQNLGNCLSRLRSQTITLLVLVELIVDIYRNSNYTGCTL